MPRSGSIALKRSAGATRSQTSRPSDVDGSGWFVTSAATGAECMGVSSVQALPGCERGQGELIADGGIGSDPGRQLQDEPAPPDNRANPPRPECMVHLPDDTVAVQVHHIDRVAHPQGM